jgi:pimeloyl-ACP methyl ester carboxylesterase
MIHDTISCMISKVTNENIKGSQLVQIEKAGHGFYFEEREGLNSELRN